MYGAGQAEIPRQMKKKKKKNNPKDDGVRET
jgi:hypothetical protein